MLDFPESLAAGRWFSDSSPGWWDVNSWMPRSPEHFKGEASVSLPVKTFALCTSSLEKVNRPLCDQRQDAWGLRMTGWKVRRRLRKLIAFCNCSTGPCLPISWLCEKNKISTWLNHRTWVSYLQPNVILTESKCLKIIVHLFFKNKKALSVQEKQDFGAMQILNLNPGFAIFYSLILASNLTSLGLSFLVYKMVALIYVP